MKIKPEFKLGKIVDLKLLDSNVVLDHLDEQIKLREMPVEKRLKLLK